ncbi:hypothetical protein K501DRAFT_198635 [Backusella circina FSU 941]|nr:hypothetical protein K501DRAFT_198635 [Backusella circina FSU 941]
METFRSLGRHCYNDICHCDWRVELYGCVESDAVRIINILNISISGLTSVIGLSILYHRIIIKGHSIMNFSPEKGLLRPKPIDSLLVFLTLFNILRLASSIILVADAASGNMVFRSFIFEFGWQFGFWGCAAYVIGIAQASAESHKSISTKWLPSPRIVDTAGFTFLIVPFVLNNTASITAAATVIYCGSRLIQTLSEHLKKFSATGERSANIKTGIFKIRSIVILLSIALYSFAFFLLFYGILRDYIIINYVGSIFLCTVWNFLGPTTTLFIQLTIIFNPKMDKKISNTAIKGSSSGQPTTVFESQNATRLNGGMNMTFQDTLTNTALDNLKLKQEESLNKLNNEVHFETAVPKEYRHVYSNNPTEMYIDDQESEYEHFELRHHNSRAQLINKTY